MERKYRRRQTNAKKRETTNDIKQTKGAIIETIKAIMPINKAKAEIVLHFPIFSFIPLPPLFISSFIYVYSKMYKFVNPVKNNQ